MKKLAIHAAAKYLVGLILVGVLLFPPAGSLYYPNAWLMLALLFVPMLVLGAVLLFKAPGLLAKRLQSREGQGAQRKVVAFSALLFVVGFVLAGLDFRFGWTSLPDGVVIAAAVVQLAAYLLYAEVMRENAWLARTVEVQQGQKVVDTGLYAIVRHPMYAAVILLFLAMPLVLGSLVSLAVFLPFPALLARRILHEEKLLASELDGYTDYMRRVKYRLFPGIW